MLFGGIMVSALVHPWFYVMVVAGALDGRIFETPVSEFGRVAQTAALCNLAAGYFTAVALGGAAACSPGRRTLAPHVLLMPVYWLAISFAAYRALFQLATAPFVWEKTEHRARTKFPSRPE